MKYGQIISDVQRVKSKKLSGLTVRFLETNIHMYL